MGDERHDGGTDRGGGEAGEGRMNQASTKSMTTIPWRCERCGGRRWQRSRFCAGCRESLAQEALARADERELCCRDVCDRCRLGHAVGLDAWGEWSHGVDTLESGVHVPPEPCAAAAIRARGAR